MKKALIFLLIASPFIFNSCNKDKDDKKNIKLTNEQVSEWIYDNMEFVYYWEDHLPQGINPLEESDPASFFYSLIYNEEDKWSFVTSDYLAFEAELQGTPESMGISPAFGKFSNSDKVFLVIEYVYPESPAAHAGLDRGDIILTIDGVALDTSNYFELFSQKSFLAGLGEYDGETIHTTGENVSLVAEIFFADPVIAHDIIEPETSKIGYLAYTEFISGVSNQFVNSLDMVISDFVTAGVKELVVDLRYNPGGQVNMAGYLASCIAPVTALFSDEILVRFLYNQKLENYYELRYGANSEAFNYRFPGSTFNLNLDRVFFLTTEGTASASELVISGLEPYMDVVVIGDSTYGKYTGAYIIPDSENPARHNWAIIPIVLKYANADGVTNFKDGLFPDVLVEDNLLAPFPLGDPDDPMLATAISIIKGMPSKKSWSDSGKSYQDLKKPDWELRSNLFMEGELPGKTEFLK